MLFFNQVINQNNKRLIMSSVNSGTNDLVHVGQVIPEVIRKLAQAALEYGNLQPGVKPLLMSIVGSHYA